MGRKPCCAKVGLNRGAWSSVEDKILRRYINAYGEGNWRDIPIRAGLKRCGKSCRLRWMNYLRPNIKRGNISAEEEDLIVKLHKLLGNRWSLIAGRLPGRTDNEIKNYWNTSLCKKVDAQPTTPRTSNIIRTEHSRRRARNKYKIPNPEPISSVNDKQVHIMKPIRTKASKCTKAEIMKMQLQPLNLQHNNHSVHHQVEGLEPYSSIYTKASEFTKAEIMKTQLQPLNSQHDHINIHHQVEGLEPYSSMHTFSSSLGTLSSFLMEEEGNHNQENDYNTLLVSNRNTVDCFSQNFISHDLPIDVAYQLDDGEWPTLDLDSLTHFLNKED